MEPILQECWPQLLVAGGVLAVLGAIGVLVSRQKLALKQGARAALECGWPWQKHDA
jgi:hypothetical protein